MRSRTLLCGIVLTTVAVASGCVDDGTRLSLYDGPSMNGGRQEVPATTFRLTKPYGVSDWYVVEWVVPDDAVEELPLELEAPEVTCRRWGSDRIEAQTCRGGRLRVVEAQHGALVAEYSVDCEGLRTEGVGAFEVAGAARDGVWSYPEPCPSPKLHPP